jgi:shikimate dehydrogenase
LTDVNTTFLVGLVGAGIQESLSPTLHHTEARKLGLQYHYRIIDLDSLPADTEPAEIMRAAQLLGFAGLNITHPAKQSIIGHLDGLAPEAEAIGAVNTVVFGPDGAIGHNTDAYGFAELARRALVNERRDRVVQFGAGGAGSAVAYAQLQASTGRLDIVDIDIVRAQTLVDRLAARFGADRVGWGAPETLRDLVGAANGFVNATPMGMAAHPGSPVPDGVISERHWVIDIVYMPLRTRLMVDAEALGARVTGGSAMTAFQAAQAFALFTGVQPDPLRMLAHMNEEVAAKRVAV